MSKILAIDDESRMLDLICAFLEHDDHEVKTATSGKAGIELAKTFAPELILCDVQMPDMDGYEVLKSVRETESLSSVPFVFLTGLDDMKHLRQGMNLGADDYLTKPFSYADLSEAINVRLEKHKAIAEHYEADIREAEAKASEALFTDDVTGLPNRKRLNEVFPARMAESPALVLLSCAFDSFQGLANERPEALVNILLKGASTRLRSLFSAEETVFYVERNQFVVLLPADAPLALRAQTLLSKLNDPYKIMQQELLLTASVGIARSPQDGQDLGTLLRKAEAARNRAEAEGGNLYRFVD